MTKDKICLDLEGFPDIAELLSRKEPGDTVKFSGSATVDEAKDGYAVLSILDGFKIVGEKAKPDASKSAAVKMFAEDEEAKEAASDTSPA